MLKHEYVTCMELHKRLKDKIIGHIFITIENDNLAVHINGGRGVRYDYVIRDISYEMFGYELNYDKIIKIILREYEEFILNRFFRR